MPQRPVAPPPPLDPSTTPRPPPQIARDLKKAVPDALPSFDAFADPETDASPSTTVAAEADATTSTTPTTKGASKQSLSRAASATRAKGFKGAASSSSTGTATERETKEKRTDAVKTGATRGRRCADAIAEGLELCGKQEWAAAAEKFTESLDLPGNGRYRLEGSPREHACPSDGEETAALYNLACCYSRMGKMDAAMEMVKAVVDAGFEELDTLRRDDDLAPLRAAMGSAFEAALAAGGGDDGSGGAVGVLGKMLGGRRKKTGSTNSPWITW